MPELELRELVKSEQPIDKEGGNKRKIEVLRPWNNYTIIALENSDKIKIIDETGKETSVPEHNSIRRLKVDWGEVSRKLGKKYIGLDSNPHQDFKADDIKLSQLGSDIRFAAESHLQNKNERWLNINSGGVSAFGGADINVLKDGKYIVCGDKSSEAYIIYITQNESGVVLYVMFQYLCNT